MNVRMWVMENFSDEKFQIMDDVELFELLCNIATGSHNYFEYCDETDLEKLIELNIVGLELEKLWQMSGQLEYVFCYYLSFLPTVFTEEQIHANLTLNQPVPFVENFDKLIEEFDLADEEKLKSMTSFRVACMQQQVRNNFVLRYNEQCKNEGYDDLFTLEPALVEKDIMDESEYVSVYDVYYGVREIPKMYHYPIFLKSNNRYIYQDHQVYKQFQDIPYLNTYLVELFPSDYSRVKIIPYQDYEKQRDEDYVHIMPLIDIIKDTQKYLEKDLELNWRDKWGYQFQIQHFLSRITEDDMIMVNDLLGFADFFAFCYEYSYDIYSDFEFDQKTMRLVPKN